ncbi:hypothetical protein NXS19_009148 [Fusarium pseudograminearum]|nr:hypothetical protein NXS19_009148 [Fusarium pseudograminearum]
MTAFGNDLTALFRSTSSIPKFEIELITANVVSTFPRCHPRALRRLLLRAAALRIKMDVMASSTGTENMCPTVFSEFGCINGIWTCKLAGTDVLSRAFDTGV